MSNFVGLKIKVGSDNNKLDNFQFTFIGSINIRITSPFITLPFEMTIAPMTTAMMTTTANTACVNALETVIDPVDCKFISNVALVFVILSIVLIIWGLFNNIILLVIIFTNGRQMRTIPNIFIASMAILGVLFLLIVSGGNIFIFGQVAFQVKIVKSDSATKAVFLVQVFVSVASFTILVFLGFDRYLSIVHPFRSRAYRTKKRTIIANCLVWLVAGLCMIPVLLGGGSQNLFENYSVPAQRNSMIIFVAISFIIPVIALLIMYVAILKVIWFNPTTKQLNGEEQERRWKQRIQVFRSIFRVVFTFILLYGYFFAIFMWIAVGGHTQVSPRLSNSLLYSSILVVYLNTGMNPVIYALNQQAFRPFVYKILCPKRFDLRKPKQDALCTTQQNNEFQPNATPMTSRTPQNGQAHVLRSINEHGSTEVNGDVNIVVDDGSHHQYLNEGYHDKENAKNGVSSWDGTGTSEPEPPVCVQLDAVEPIV